MTHKTSILPLLKKNFGRISHFKCRLNRQFWRQEKWYKLSKLGGGGVEVIWTKSKRTVTFFSGNHSLLTEHDFNRKSLDILEA